MVAGEPYEMLTLNLANEVNTITYQHIVLQIWRWCETLFLYVTNLTYTVVLLNAFTKIKYAKDSNTNVNRELRTPAVGYCRRVLLCLYLLVCCSSSKSPSFAINSVLELPVVTYVCGVYTCQVSVVPRRDVEGERLNDHICMLITMFIHSICKRVWFCL